MTIDFIKSIVILQRTWRQKTPDKKSLFHLQVYYECKECGDMFYYNKLRAGIICYPCYFSTKYS